MRTATSINRFAEMLKELRVTKRLTQEEVSQFLNTDRSSIANYERGKRMPPMDSLIRIAKFFDVSLDYLVLGKNHKSVVRKDKYDEEMMRELMAENTALMEECCKLHDHIGDKDNEIKLLKDMMESMNKYVHYLEEKIKSSEQEQG